MRRPVEHHLPDGRRYLRFEFDIVRAWEQSVDRLLNGGIGTLPLAPLADVTLDHLPDVIRVMDERRPGVVLRMRVYEIRDGKLVRQG